MKTAVRLCPHAVGLLVAALSVLGCSERGPAVKQTTSRLTSSSGFVVFAYKEVSVGPQSTVTGSVGVRDATPGQVTLSTHVELTGDVLGNVTKIASQAVVTGQVTANSLDIHPKATLSQPAQTPLGLPLPDISPPVPPVEPSTQQVTVAGRATTTLAAGAYGQVRLLDGSATAPTVLRLAGGLYQWKELQLGNHCRVECVAACEVRLEGRFQAGDHVFVGPATGTLRRLIEIM